MRDAPVLEVEKLTAGYGGPPVISGVSISAKQGAITAIVGPNGAGKSTLLKAIAGLIRPTEGSVKFKGGEVTGLPAEKLVRRGLAYVPQVANVFPDLTIRENLDMGGYSRKDGVRERIDELFKLFPDLAASSNRKAHALSGGQRTMLALARGLIVDPAVLILDEPSAGLAPKVQGLIWERIEAIRASDVAVLVIEQNTPDTLPHAQWSYWLWLRPTPLQAPGKA